MAHRTEFFVFVGNPSHQRPLPPLPCEIDEARGARVLRKQSPVVAGTTDTRGTMNPTYPGSPDRRQHRKLKRAGGVVKAQATIDKLSGFKSPGNSDPRPPSYTVEDIANYLNAPNKLTRKSFNNPVPNGWYQSGLGSPTLASPGSRNTSYFTQNHHTPYSESRGEFQRQFAISQRLKRKHRIGSPDPIEVAAYLGGLERIHDGDGWVDGFRLEVEKPLQQVSVQRLQPGSRGSPMIMGKPKKVRFASVVECFEF